MPGKDAAVAIAAVIAFSFSTLLMFSVSPATGAQWLTNGSFDAGTSGWEILGPIADGCGAGAAGLLVTDQGVALAQNAAGPFPAGTYRFTGQTRLLAANEVSMVLTVRDLNSTIKWQSPTYWLTTSTTNWSLDVIPATELGAIRVTISLGSDVDTVACFDNLAFEGPISVTPPTATPTSTPVPASTSTPLPSATSTATAQPASTATSVPAATATSAAPTLTSAPATATPVPPTATSAPSLVFSNGGFEDETAGWRKNGGAIEVVTSPKRSGDAAGRFWTSSASTSWVYQTIAIDAGKAYEFGGALLPDDAVGEAYLRISWYASSDGSGSLISSDDSPTRIGAGGSSFVWLSTGPKNPPAGAHSARLRVMLAPLGGAEASVYLDDFSLTTGPLIAAVSTPTAAPAATQTARAVEATQDARSGTGDSEATPPPPGSTSGSTSSVAGVRATAAASQVALAAATGGSEAPSPKRSASGPGTGSNSGRGGESAAATQQDEPAPLWPYFALPAAGLLGIFGLIHARKKAAASG
ncbi:MAG: hypothetical protein AB7T32_18190 [Dehalococcoidia bacterium]